MSGIPDDEGIFHIKVDDGYAFRHHLRDKKAERLNSGLIVYKKDALTVESFAEYFTNVLLPKNDYFVEMTGWCCCIAQTNYLLLPPDRYILKGRPGRLTVMKHFTSPRRHELFAYGISRARISMSR